MSKIKTSILAALRDCASFRNNSYIWKRKTMIKAVSAGLAEEVKHQDKTVLITAFNLTDAGFAALAEKDS